MGCSIQDQTKAYSYINRKTKELNPKANPVEIQKAVNKYWLELENNIMTEAEKLMYIKVTEQTEGVARINLGGLDQLNEPIVILKDLGDEYVVHLLSGQNYTFKKGSVDSNKTRAKRFVTMETMVLTKPSGRVRLAVQADNKNTKVYNMLVKEAGSEVALNGADVGRYSKTMKEVILKLVKPTVKADPLLTTKAIWSIINDMKVNSGQYSPRNHTVKFLQTKNVEGQIAESIFDADYIEYEDIKKDLMNTEVFQKRVDFVEAELNKYTNDHTMLHELIHAGSAEFMRNNPNHPATKRVQKIFELAKKEIDDTADINFGYWKTNEYEFLAEALSNPKMIRELMSIQPKEKYGKLSNLFDSLISNLLGMLGLEKAKKDSLMEYLLDGYFSMVEEQFVRNDPKNTELAKAIKEEADKLMEKRGSDTNTGIGDTESDVFLDQEQTNLGQTMVEKYIEMTIQGEEKSSIEKLNAQMKKVRELEAKVMEYNDKNEEAPKTLMDSYNKEYDIGVELTEKLSEFDRVTATILNTYQSTMQNLGTGQVKLRMFESMKDQTAGQIDLRTKEMHIRWNKMSRLSRVSEVFLHEINHLMSAHVFKNNKSLRKLMQDLRDSAVASGVTYELFLDGIENPTQEEVAIAKMKFEYTFDKTANIEEFYAYATTNEQVYKAIKDVEITTQFIKELKMDSNKKSPFKKVINVLIKIVNDQWKMLTGRSTNGGQMIVDMVQTIAKLDAEAAQAKWQKEEGPEGVSDYAKTKINALDQALAPVIKKADEWNEKLSAKQSAKWLANHIKKIPILNDLVETGISQYLWRMVTQDTTKENVADMYMVFRQAKQVVEKHTSDIRNGVKAVATELYKDIKEDTKKAVLRVVLEGDLAQFSAADLKMYLEDEVELDKKIAELESEAITTADPIAPVKSKREQINGLVEYLLTGKTIVHNQQTNANNIAANMMGDLVGKPSKAMVRAIDQLVSLRVLKESDTVHKDRLKELLATESGLETLDKTINMYRGYIDNMREDATIGANDPIPKGYTRPEDGLVKYELIPKEEVEAQQSVLMKLIEEKPYVIVEGKEYFLMTGRTKSVGFNEGALGLISHTTEGIPVSLLIRRNNELAGKVRLMDGELKRKTKNIINAINDQDESIIKKFKLGAGQTLIPVYNHQNKIVDYRIQLNKLEKEIYLTDRKTGLEDTMSHTFSRSIKTTLTASENKRVVDKIIEDSANGVLENPDDYVLVEEYTEEDKMNGVKYEKRHDRWAYLPDHTKDYIFKRIRSKGILIHKDYVELMTGEKDVTIGNFAKFGLDLKKYPTVRARVMAIESYISEILGYVKNAMVVLNFDVLAGNQTSNAIVAMTHGINPIRYTKKFKQRWDDLNDYNEKSQQLAELEVKKMSGEDVASRINQLKKQLEGNVWDELVKDGQYTALVEDINIEGQGEGQLLTMANDYLEKKNWKGAIDNVKNALYINRTSAFYNTMLKTVHYGDAITRQIIKEELEEIAVKRDGKITKDVETEILNYLDQLLVNYGYTMNRWWKYAERVGGLFFMKYYLSQAKAIMSMTKRNPAKTALMQGAQRLTGIDFQDPIDTYLRTGIDGVAYRWMFDNAPEQILRPNIFDLIPDISSIVRMN